MISNITKFNQELNDGHMYEGSGSILQYQLVISKICSCEGSSYFPLPKGLRSEIKGLIDVQNVNNECFRWCMVIYLNLVSKNPPKIRNADKKFGKQLNFKE